MLGSSMRATPSNTLVSTAAYDIPDNIIFSLGNDKDGVLVLNTAGLAADATLTSAIVGTARRMATGVNSLLISNITTDGDIQFLISDGGHSWGMLTFNADDHSAHFGQDDYGVDVKLYGETASCYCLWDASADALYITGTHDAGSEYSLKIVDTATFVAVAAHKSAQVELTYAPSSAGTACPIAIVGKVTLNGNLTAANNYPGMGWGIQGQIHIATGSTIDGSTYGDPGAVYAGVRGVLTDAGTSTYTKGILAALFSDIQLTQNASALANFKVYGAYIYLYNAAGNTNVDAMVCIDKHASALATTIEKAIYIKADCVVGLDIGSVTTGIDFTGTITGNGIDFTDVTMVPSGSGGTAFIRAGVYGDPATTTFVENSSVEQSGMIRLYGATSADGTSYDRGVFVCLVTTGTKGIFPVAGLAEVRDQSGNGPTAVMGAQFICDLHTTGAKLAALSGAGGMYGAWLKITAIDGATISATARAAPLWLDNQLYGNNAAAIGEEYTIFSTTGGTVPKAWAAFETSSVGWAQLFYFDETAYDQSPISSNYLKVLLNTTQYYIPLSTTAGSFTGTLGAVTLSGNITVSAAYDVILQANTAAALEITDGTIPYYIVDTRTTVDNVRAHTFDRADHTMASSAANEASLMRFLGWTLNYTGNTQVTTQLANLMCTAWNIVANGVGGSLTVDFAAYLCLKAPVEGNNVVLTNTTAIHIQNSTGTPVTQSGIYIDDLTVGATSDYGIYIVGADTAAIIVASADPIQLGVAGASTGTMNIQGVTSGVVTLTVAATAGTWTLTLPAAVGTAGYFLVDAAGNGISSWSNSLPAITLTGAVTGGNQDLNSIGHIGIGNQASIANVGIYFDQTFTDTTNTNYYGFFSATRTQKTTAAFTGITGGGHFTGFVAASNDQNWTTAVQAVGLRGVTAVVETSSGATGTIAGAAALYAEATIAAATITGLSGLYINNATGGGTVTTQYGIYIADLTKGGTDYGIYIAGADTAAIYIAADDIMLANGKVSFTGSLDSAAVADQVSLGGFEISAGHRALAISSEEVVVTEAVGASDRTLPVRINGATYKLMLHT